jgi:hypothetical protein
MASSAQQEPVGFSIGRTCFGMIMAAAFCLASDAGTTSWGAAPAAAIESATTSRQARHDALASIPMHQLSAEAQARIAAVVQSASMFRRMPVNMIDCDWELHRFLIRHPEVVVNIWQLMGITKVTADRLGPYQLACADGAGTVTTLELVYGDHDTHLIYCNGSYDGPLFRKPLTGRCVLLLKSGHVRGADGSQQVTNRLDMFLQIDHAGVEALTRTLHPLFGRSADVNFLESMKFLQRISRTAERNGPGMCDLARRLEDVQPGLREDFAAVVARVSARHAERRVAHQLPANRLTE